MSASTSAFPPIAPDERTSLERVAILRDPSMGVSGLADAQSGAQALALEPLFFEAGEPAQFEAIFAEAANRGVNGLAGMASPFLNFHHRRLVDLANTHRFPSIWEAAGYVRDGGLLSYGPSFPEIGEGPTRMDLLIRGKRCAPRGPLDAARAPRAATPPRCQEPR
jgi:hypothetical protein